MLGIYCYALKNIMHDAHAQVRRLRHAHYAECPWCRCGGFGSHMLGASGALLLAIVMKRALLIDVEKTVPLSDFVECVPSLFGEGALCVSFERESNKSIEVVAYSVSFVDLEYLLDDIKVSPYSS